MELPEKALKKLAKEVIELEKELMYDDSYTEDQRITTIERLITDTERKLTEPRQRRD